MPRQACCIQAATTYDVVSFDMHRGELHIYISSEPNWDEKRKFYPASYGITKLSLEED